MITVAKQREKERMYKYSLVTLQIMNDLINKKCVPCEGGVPALDLSEIYKYQKKS